MPTLLLLSLTIIPGRSTDVVIYSNELGEHVHRVMCFGRDMDQTLSQSLLMFDDPLQKAVITTPSDARVIVEAGPGTGKTAVGCARVAWLVAEGGISPTSGL